MSLQFLNPLLQDKQHRPLNPLRDLVYGIHLNDGSTFSGESRTVADRQTEKWLMVTDGEKRIDTLVREALREAAQLRWAGLLRPFFEGEAIGAAPKRRRQRKLTPAQFRKLHNQRMQWKQEDLLKLRRKNDAAMALIIKGRL